jgi:hypothetical protein
LLGRLIRSLKVASIARPCLRALEMMLRISQNPLAWSCHLRHALEIQAVACSHPGKSI